jgi:hypothetical protein
MACLRHQSQAEVLGWLAELSALTLVFFVPIRLGTTFPIGRVLLEQVRENCGEFMGRGGRGLGRPQFAAHAAREGAERARALPQTLRRHAQGPAGPIVAPSTARREPFAATNPVVGTEPSPGGTMFVRRPCTPIEASCGEAGVERQGLEARHLGELHPGDPGQMSTEIKRRRVSLWLSRGGCRWGEGVGIKINPGRKGAEGTFDVLSAGRHVLLGTSRERQGLGEREAMCRAIIPLERLDNGVRTGFAAIVSILGSGARVAFSSDYRAEKAQTCHACHITHHVVQVQMHLVQRLVHVLHMFDRHLEQIVSMAEKPAELADVLRRTKRRRQPSIAMQLLEPPTSTAIRCRPPRDNFDMAGIDESDLKAAGFEDLKQRHPGHPGGFQHDSGNPTGCYPVGEPMQVTGKGAKVRDRLGIAIRGHTDPVLLSPHIDTCGMWMEHGHSFECTCVLLAFFSHTCLRSGEEWGEEGKTGLLRCKDTRGGGRRRDCFILREPRRSVGGTLTTQWSGRPTAQAFWLLLAQYLWAAAHRERSGAPFNGATDCSYKEPYMDNGMRTRQRARGVGNLCGPKPAKKRATPASQTRLMARVL